MAIELKLGSFKPAYKGQILILCAGKKDETVRLLDLEGAGIRVASYWTEALPREQLEQKLHEAVRLARQRLAAAELPNDGERKAP